MKMYTCRPTPLYLFPSGEVTLLSYPDLRRVFLSSRRNRQRLHRIGCFGVVDVNGEPREYPDREEKNLASAVTDDESKIVDSCQFASRLRGKARTCLRFLKKELRLKRARALPSRIECGHLRPAIRSCFDQLSEVEELSVKTTQKLEKSFCRWCENANGQAKVDKWKEERFREVEVEEDHLSQFAAQFGRNIEPGWNRGKYPYIPNGHACLGVTRREGGTWIPGEFSLDCEVQSVVSAGKPRIVTLFSERNNQILYPLHRSLYGSLKKKGWLLVGSPTHEQVSSLNGGAYISVDYSSATDMIKSAYTRAAVEVLIDKGEGLNEDEVAALRVLGSLRVDGVQVTRGQPMGSLMSFPLLCLINKTVVDLAHNDLLIEGKIGAEEWRLHRCLINGDDLLLRDLSVPGLMPRIVAHGERVGLIVNDDKTMVHAKKGEINSTLFDDGIEQKKINCGALFMGRDVEDVIGFADRSSVTTEGFMYLVRRHKNLLARASSKIQSPLCYRRFNALVRDKEIRRALCSVPTSGAESTNPFPVVTKPVGYDLSREEEIVLIDARVCRLREEGYTPRKCTRPNITEGGTVSLRAALKRKKPSPEVTLRVLAQGWELKTKENLKTEDSPVYIVPYEHVCDECASRSRICRFICEIRELQRQAWLPVRANQVPGDDPPEGWTL